MATISKLLLGGSTNGKNISIASTGSAVPTTIHTAIAGTTSFDELWVYGCNTATASLSCSITWGATTAIDTTTVLLNPYGGRTLLMDGKLLQNGLIVGAYATLGGYIFIDGYCNRIV